MKPILNVDEGATLTVGHGDAFAARVTPLAERLGATQIGANITAVPPGHAPYPCHHHYANEEHFFVLSGSGTLRFGADTFPLRAGDYVYTPPGGPEVAHQFINTGTEELVFLAISTKRLPEVVGYPDSAKTGVRTSSERDSGRFLVEDRHRDAMGYWDGEDGAAVHRIAKGS